MLAVLGICRATVAIGNTPVCASGENPGLQI